MKPSSKIFLIIALVAIGLGVILMGLGAIIANSGGETLFAEDVDGGKGYVYEYDNLSGKLKIEANDTQINIIGGSEKTYMEVVNFNENLFTYSETSAMVSFKESADIGSTFQFWDGNFSFKGLRFLFKPTVSTGEKKINVYLADDDRLTDIIISSVGGKVTISNLSSNTSYTLETTNTPVKLSDISTNQSISLTDYEGQSNLSLENVEAKDVLIDVLHSEITGDIICDTLTIKDVTGSVNLTYAPRSFKEFYGEIDVVASRLVVDGAEYENSYRSMEAGIDLVDEDGNSLYAMVDIDGTDLSVELETPLDAPVEEIPEQE